MRIVWKPRLERGDSYYHEERKKRRYLTAIGIRHVFSARGQGDYERMNANQFMETIWQGYRE